MTCIVMACTVTADIVMDYIVMACIGMAYIVMAYTSMAHILRHDIRGTHGAYVHARAAARAHVRTHPRK